MKSIPIILYRQKKTTYFRLKDKVFNLHQIFLFKKCHDPNLAKNKCIQKIMGKYSDNILVIEDSVVDGKLIGIATRFDEAIFWKVHFT